MKGRIEYFKTLEVTPGDPLSPVIIVPNPAVDFPFNVKKGGSYSLAQARILGLSYANYLRFLRDSFPDVVTLVGKNSYYVVAHWKRGSRELNTFLDFLNAKMTNLVKGG